MSIRDESRGETWTFRGRSAVYLGCRSGGAPFRDAGAFIEREEEDIVIDGLGDEVERPEDITDSDDNCEDLVETLAVLETTRCKTRAVAR